MKSTNKFFVIHGGQKLETVVLTGWSNVVRELPKLAESPACRLYAVSDHKLVPVWNKEKAENEKYHKLFKEYEQQKPIHKIIPHKS